MPKQLKNVILFFHFGPIFFLSLSLSSSIPFIQVLKISTFFEKNFLL